VTIVVDDQQATVILRRIGEDAWQQAIRKRLC
jgi:hypothetical protein